MFKLKSQAHILYDHGSLTVLYDTSCFNWVCLILIRKDWFDSWTRDGTASIRDHLPHRLLDVGLVDTTDPPPHPQLPRPGLRRSVQENSYFDKQWATDKTQHEISIVAGSIVFLGYIDGLVQERRNSSALAMELHLSCTNSSTWYIDGLVQERRNSSALAMELHLSCTNSSTWYIDGLVQERRNSSALAMELHLSCTNSSIWYIDGLVQERRNPSALAMELCLSCTNPPMWYHESKHIPTSYQFYITITAAVSATSTSTTSESTKVRTSTGLNSTGPITLCNKKLNRVNDTFSFQLSTTLKLPIFVILSRIFWLDACTGYLPCRGNMD